MVKASECPARKKKAADDPTRAPAPSAPLRLWRLAAPKTALRRRGWPQRSARTNERIKENQHRLVSIFNCQRRLRIIVIDQLSVKSLNSRTKCAFGVRIHILPVDSRQISN